MRKDKGFALVGVMVISLVVFILGVAAVYISNFGFASISSTQKYYVAEKNANYGLMKAIEQIYTGSLECGNTTTYTTNKGTAKVISLKGGNACFIWSKGEFMGGKVVKVGAISTGSGSDIATLSFNNFSGDAFNLKNNAKISSGSNDCPALSYYDCGAVCPDILSYEGGAIDGDVNNLSSEINPEEAFFAQSIDGIKEDLKKRFNTKFEEVSSSLPSPPEVTNPSCIVSNASSCKIKWSDKSVIDCGSAGEVDTSACPDGVKILGDTVSFDFWAGEVQAPLVIEANSVDQIDLGSTTIEGGLYVVADSIDCGDECVSISMDNSTQIRGDLYIKATTMDGDVKLSNSATINGNVYTIADETVEEGELELHLSNNSSISGMVYFTGTKMEIDLANNAGIGGDVVAKASHEVEIELANNTYINGSVYAYASDEAEIESVNSTKLGGMENLILSEGEIELKLANNAEQAVGTIAWVGNNLEESEAEIELANDTYIDGFLLLGKVEEVNLPNNTHLKGAVVIQSLGDELKLSNNSSIQGLLLTLSELGLLDMANSSQIEGLVFANNILEGIELTNNSNIALNIDLINQLIKDYGLADYFKELKCEGGKMKVVGMFIMSVY